MSPRLVIAIRLYRPVFHDAATPTASVATGKTLNAGQSGSGEIMLTKSS